MANQLYKGDKPLATFVPQIADNLTTNDSTKALSAKQGKVLNEKIESMGYREVGRASLNQTFAQQLAQLKTAYDSLSGLEKMASVIFTANQYFYPTNIDNGRAVYSSFLVGGAFACTSLDINNATMKYISGSFTVNDNSTGVNNTIMFLYVSNKMS